MSLVCFFSVCTRVLLGTESHAAALEFFYAGSLKRTYGFCTKALYVISTGNLGTYKGRQDKFITFDWNILLTKSITDPWLSWVIGKLLFFCQLSGQNLAKIIYGLVLLTGMVPSVPLGLNGLHCSACAQAASNNTAKLHYLARWASPKSEVSKVNCGPINRRHGVRVQLCVEKPSLCRWTHISLCYSAPPFH